MKMEESHGFPALDEDQQEIHSCYKCKRERINKEWSGQEM